MWDVLFEVLPFTLLRLGLLPFLYLVLSPYPFTVAGLRETSKNQADTDTGVSTATAPDNNRAIPESGPEATPRTRAGRRMRRFDIDLLITTFIDSFMLFAGTLTEYIIGASFGIPLKLSLNFLRLLPRSYTRWDIFEKYLEYWDATAIVFITGILAVRILSYFHLTGTINVFAYKRSILKSTRQTGGPVLQKRSIILGKVRGMLYIVIETPLLLAAMSFIKYSPPQFTNWLLEGTVCVIMILFICLLLTVLWIFLATGCNWLYHYILPILIRSYDQDTTDSEENEHPTVGPAAG